MSNRHLYAALCGVLAVLVAQPALSHEIVGNRMFPATLTIDDPGVADELSLPTAAISKTGDVPPVKQLDISGEYSKLITEDFAVIVRAHLDASLCARRTQHGRRQRLPDIETTFKYRLFKNVEHEFVASVGFNIEWVESGARTSAPTASTPTRRRSISAKASAICHRA